MAIFDITYVGDMPYLKLEGGTVTGATTFNSSIAANSGSITNNLAVGSINGVTVGQSPKFTDTTYSVATTSVAGLMSTTDKTAVNKVGTGTLNTTNKTIIPAINELKSTDSSLTTRITTIENKINTTPSAVPPEIRNLYTSGIVSGSTCFQPKTYTITGQVGDTVLVFAQAYTGTASKTAVAPSGFSAITNIQSAAGATPSSAFIGYMTSTTQNVTVSWTSTSSDSIYRSFSTIIVLKGRYIIEASAKMDGAVYHKPHQGYYFIVQGSSVSNNSWDSDLRKAGVTFDQDSITRTISASNSSSTSMTAKMIVCVQITADWGDSELPVNTVVMTSVNTNPASELGYGSWSTYSPTSQGSYYWRRTS